MIPGLAAKTASSDIVIVHARGADW